MKKITFLLLCLAFTGCIWAQDSNTFALKMDHIALSVKDVNNSVAFYTNVLKLQEITNKTKKEGIRWISLGDGKELHLISTMKEPVITNRAVHFAFMSANFYILVKALEAQNIMYWDWAGTQHNISVRADGIKQI